MSLASDAIESAFGSERPFSIGVEEHAIAGMDGLLRELTGLTSRGLNASPGL